MLLELDGQVRIPGIGRLTRTVRPAGLTDHNTVLYPPEANASFDTTAEGRGKLLEKYIADQSGYERKDVREALIHLSTEIKVAITKHGYARYDGFGTFTMEQSEFQFSPFQEAFNARYHGLVNVPILAPATSPSSIKQPVETAKVTAPSAVAIPIDHTALSQTTPSTDTNTRKKRVPVFIALMMALLVLICAFAYIQYRMKQSALAEQALFNRSPIAEQVVTTPPTVLDTPIREKAGIPEQLITTLADVLQEEEVAEPSEPTVTTTEPKTSTLNTPLNTMTASDPCLIVLGAFGLQSNVDRMLVRLTNLGMTGTTIARGGLTVVGVPVSCSGNVLQSRLNLLRSEIEQSAWILKR